MFTLLLILLYCIFYSTYRQTSAIDIMYASKYVHKSISVSVGTFEASIFDSKSSLIRRQSSILILYLGLPKSLRE